FHTCHRLVCLSLMLRTKRRFISVPRRCWDVRRTSLSSRRYTRALHVHHRFLDTSSHDQVGSSNATGDHSMTIDRVVVVGAGLMDSEIALVLYTLLPELGDMAVRRCGPSIQMPL